MKININTLAIVAGLFLFTACNNDNNDDLANGEVKLNVNISQINTRVTTTDATTSFTAQFGTDDEIGVYALESTQTFSDATYKNIKYTKNSSGDWETTTTVTYPTSGTLTFYAYYPYQETVSDPTALDFTVSDQNNDTSMKSNLMYANTSALSSGNVTLTFSHKVAFVQLIVEPATAATTVDLTKLTIATINNVVPTVELNLSDGTATTASASATSLVMREIETNTTSSAKYWVLLPAQTIAAGTKLFTITYNGESYTYTIGTGSDLFLVNGTVQRYKLTINDDNSGSVTSISAGSSINDFGDNSDSVTVSE